MPGEIWTRLFVLLGLGVLAYLGYLAILGKDDFRITVRGGQVHYRGRFPLGRRGETTEFLLRDVAPTRPLRITGNWQPGRVLRIDVRGTASAGESQRIRNFLKITLKG